jgi:ribosomal protein L37AE/L43A
MAQEPKLRQTGEFWAELKGGTPKCDNCHKEVGIVYRANEKGIPGVWWCQACMEAASKPIDPEVLSFLSELEQNLGERSNE